ncbi:hypothetical protein Bca4012_066078 [Brassica carinata]
MLFIATTHSLTNSPFLRHDISDGMKSYLTPCSGEFHLPIFRSLIEDLEDILANQVM